jgi:hypothetical protein
MPDPPYEDDMSGLVMYWDTPEPKKPEKKEEKGSSGFFSNLWRKIKSYWKKILSRSSTLKKITIKPSDPKDELKGMYNPPEYTFTKAVPWHEHKAPERVSPDPPSDSGFSDYRRSAKFNLDLIRSSGLSSYESTWYRLAGGGGTLQFINKIDVSGRGYPGGSRGGNSGDSGLAPGGVVRPGHYSGGGHAGAGAGAGGRARELRPPLGPSTPRSTEPTPPAPFKFESVFPTRWELPNMDSRSGGSTVKESIVVVLYRHEFA